MIFHRNRFWIAAALFSVFLCSGLAWSASGTVDINTATEGELAELEGIGPAKAKAIVAYRKANGPFKQAEDLMKVSGIGAKTFQSNKDRISVGGGSARPSVSTSGKKEMKSTPATGTSTKTSGSSGKKSGSETDGAKSSSTTRKDTKKQ